MTEDDRCQSIFLNLLRLLHTESIPAYEFAPTYVREFFQTERCDKYADFRQQRRAYESFIGEENLRRIKEYVETPVDERRAAQARLHYGRYDERLLSSSLTWPNWLMYHSVYKLERALDRIELETKN